MSKETFQTLHLHMSGFFGNLLAKEKVSSRPIQRFMVGNKILSENENVG